MFYWFFSFVFKVYILVLVPYFVKRKVDRWLMRSLWFPEHTSIIVAAKRGTPYAKPKFPSMYIFHICFYIASFTRYIFLFVFAASEAVSPLFSSAASLAVSTSFCHLLC